MGWLDQKLSGDEPIGFADHWIELGKLLSKYQTSGNFISDLHLAALAIENGGTLCSTDRDFQRFSEISWLNPLAADE